MTQNFKRDAAANALHLVKPGMVLGLGTGSTVNEFIQLLSVRIKDEALDLQCVATSKATERVAAACGILITDFNEIESVDLTVDGADEIDRSLNLIKGGGGALLREKIVAMASDHVCIIADHSKYVSQLGRFALPVEVVEFGLSATMSMIEAAAEDTGCHGQLVLRRDAQGRPFITDGGHFIVDCAFQSIPDPESLADVLDIIPGVVEHGLFIGIADEVFIAGAEGILSLQAPAN